MKVIPASEFDLDPVNKTCICPAGESMWLHREGKDKFENQKLIFEGRLTKCRHCKLKTKCMRNPESANTRKGNGRQVSFIIQKGKRAANFTNWMKHPRKKESSGSMETVL